MASFGILALSVAAIQGAVAAVTFTVPGKAHSGGLKYAPLDPAPVGISFEFFAFPSYFTNVTATTQCLSNWKDLTGIWPPIRIGGTTQDRALYDSSTSAYVVYSVSSPSDAPASLTFGSSFMTLAGSYDGSVVVGLNRGKNQIQNTIDAAKVAVSEVKNLLAIELGNEPEYYSGAGQPIASGSWSPAIDAASQNNWDISVGSAVKKAPIIQAGNSNDSPPTWGAAELIATENATYPEEERLQCRRRSGQVCGRWITCMGAPYYGAYAATDFLAKASYLTALDDGSSNYATYVSFDSDGAPLKALLYNSDYFSGSGSRSSQSFVLQGLTGSSLKAKRLTAASAQSRVDQGATVTYGGQSFTDGNCNVSGTETYETLAVSNGQITVTINASEALVVLLQ
ncbi:hypothetical protein ABKA04_002284 [Annulohypoxylon sp. FPYF3050]